MKYKVLRFSQGPYKGKLENRSLEENMKISISANNNFWREAYYYWI